MSSWVGTQLFDSHRLAPTRNSPSPLSEAKKGLKKETRPLYTTKISDNEASS